MIENRRLSPDFLVFVKSNVYICNTKPTSPAAGTVQQPKTEAAACQTSPQATIINETQ